MRKAGSKTWTYIGGSLKAPTLKKGQTIQIPLNSPLARTSKAGHPMADAIKGQVASAAKAIGAAGISPRNTLYGFYNQKPQGKGNFPNVLGAIAGIPKRYYDWREGVYKEKIETIGAKSEAQQAKLYAKYYDKAAKQYYDDILNQQKVAGQYADINTTSGFADSVSDFFKKASGFQATPMNIPTPMYIPEHIIGEGGSSAPMSIPTFSESQGMPQPQAQSGFLDKWGGPLAIGGIAILALIMLSGRGKK